MRNFGNRGYIGIVLSVWFLLIITSIQSTVYGAPDPIDVYRESGEIIGVVDLCSGNDGIVVYIPGRSFSANVNSSNGSYKLNWVPPGVYSLCIAKNGEVIKTINGVTVVKKTITDIGTTVICRDADEDGYTENEDCNDLNPNINPGAEEVCDGVDNNCDNSVDEGCASCTDADEDGFYAQAGCTTLVDCDDFDATINPIATEVCDGKDNDCDGQADNLDNLDGDEYTICDDCDDTDSTVYPGATEMCDGLDNNCDNAIDEGLSDCDTDGDDFTPAEGDCDNTDSTVYPGATEICNGVDNDCNDIIDDNCVAITCTDEEIALAEDCIIGCQGNPSCFDNCVREDNDGDGMPDVSDPCIDLFFALGICSFMSDCPTDEYFLSCLEENCADEYLAVYGSWPECIPTPDVCDGIDNDCDGVVDNGSFCDDGNECTDDSCVAGSCINTPVVDETPCDDGNACTTSDSCSAGSCIGIDSLDDGIACTIDECDPEGYGITHSPDDSLCDDGNECTDDSCDGVGGCISVNLQLGESCAGGQGVCDGSGNCIVPVCGNGVVEPGEGCDDGNAVGGDGCTADCLIEFTNECVTDSDCSPGWHCDTQINHCVVY